MMCPKCRKEMLAGFIPDVVSWIPQYGKTRIYDRYADIKKNNKRVEDGFRIGKHFLSGTIQPAYYCPNCEFIIIDVTEESHAAGLFGEF